VKYELGLYIPEDGILHSHRREILKYYTLQQLCCAMSRREINPSGREYRNYVAMKGRRSALISFIFSNEGKKGTKKGDQHSECPNIFLRSAMTAPC
jgi:hypothetical protein